MPYKDVTEEQFKTNPYAALVEGQTIIEIPEYHLECGETLYNFPVAYKTWGKLNEEGTNTLLITHALSGSAAIDSWWGELLGKDKAFDPSKYFIICINFLGSPYGSCSPVTIDKSTGKRYGPTFPLVTFKDDVGIQRLLLDSLGVKLLAAIIGGSMGGMLALEYLVTYNNTGYVKKVVALATAARTSAWCISWNEAQRQCIFSDGKYNGGYYYDFDDKPLAGLAAARMAALLTYRSGSSFDTRFGRKMGGPNGKDEELFSAQSYLRYNGSKFVDRFDTNCYVVISRKMDCHDLSRGFEHDGTNDPLVTVLQGLTTPTLVVGIESDQLFPLADSKLLADNLPSSLLKVLNSEEGHDAFLLEFEKINSYIVNFLNE
ncbi:Homoserine O-acetyltransferase [Candida viswanathii]|uniref:Homoserine O-acetyltransferase n=1 Tax=Candida viswanathii TaxID=5486 RepID=A0A367XZT1_9ASCO|nr:Homoserine O-acetyltransferase [Candida viswanathii]